MTRGRLRMARGRLWMACGRLRMARVPKTGRLRMVLCRLRMAGRLRMAEVSIASRLRMARSHLRMAMAVYGWPGSPFKPSTDGGRARSEAGRRRCTTIHQGGSEGRLRQVVAQEQIPGRSLVVQVVQVSQVHSRDTTVCRSWRNRWDSRNPDSSWHSDL